MTAPLVTAAPGDKSRAGGAGMSKSIFDYQGLCERVAGRVDMVEELLGMLRASYPVDRQQLLEKLHAADARSARDIAHRVKGQLQTLGLKCAAERASQLERLSRDGQLEQALAALADLDSEFRRFEELELERRCVVSH
ncbi:MAG: Hpt domain-containing protein [Planctomycetaceae bacterium]|nr:Hpt domain-containing protein [Planctomycetaceae bacterium]